MAKPRGRPKATRTTPDLKLVEDELRQQADTLGEPDAQDTVELDAAAQLRIGNSNDWQRAEVNARINRAMLEKTKKPEAEVLAAIKVFTDQMEKALRMVAEIDELYPKAKARAREIIELQRVTRERVKAGHLAQCPRCLFEFIPEAM